MQFWWVQKFVSVLQILWHVIKSIRVSKSIFRESLVWCCRTHLVGGSASPKGHMPIFYNQTVKCLWSWWWIWHCCGMHKNQSTYEAVFPLWFCWKARWVQSFFFLFEQVLLATVLAKPTLNMTVVLFLVYTTPLVLAYISTHLWKLIPGWWK